MRTLPELAEVLRHLRRREARKRGAPRLTYRELAAKTGWSHAVIGEYFTGSALPPTDRFDELVRLLGATKAEWGPLATARDRAEEQRHAGRLLIPRELPASVAGFVGRETQLRELDRLAEMDTGGLVVAAIHGSVGTGKTALAVHWGHLLANRFPDGQLYVDLHGFDAEPLPAHDALGRLLLALGTEPDRLPDGLDERASRYRTLLADRRMLVVLDNAASGDQVRPLLPGSATCMVIVTSRDRLGGLVAGEGAHSFELGLLTEPEATLLASGLVQGPPEEIRALVRLCGRLPVAIRVVAELAAARGEASLASLVNDLRDLIELARSSTVVETRPARCTLDDILRAFAAQVSEP